MKNIDVTTWARKQHFEFYNKLDYPHFNITVPVDISFFHKQVKELRLPFFRVFLHRISKVVNSVCEFRQRIRNGDEVIEHTEVSPSFTAMTQDGIFSFCAVDYKPALSEFLEEIEFRLKGLEGNVRIEDKPGDDQFYVSCIPWVSFTSLVHPVHMSPVDSVPRICWGKYNETSGKLVMPISVQAHHALVDGYHIGEFFKALETLLADEIE